VWNLRRYGWSSDARPAERRISPDARNARGLRILISVLSAGLKDLNVIFMGDVICVYKVMPENPEDSERVRKALESLKPQRLEEEPVAFGLVAFKFTKIIPDEPGALEELEERLNKVEGIGSVENVKTSRAM
jgi:elongation factor 1-beta